MSRAMTKREYHRFMAKLAEQAERFEEMVKYMSLIAQEKAEDEELTVEERNLLSVAYKNVVGARRASWRVLSSIEMKEQAKGNNERGGTLKQYRLRIEYELESICEDILNVLSKYLIKTDKVEGSDDEAKMRQESQVFYLKMAGDYHRYLAEFRLGESGRDAMEAARQSYEKASKVAEDGDLAATNPIILGLALNFSVFYYEILNNPKKACTLAKTAFDNAVARLDALDEHTYKDATLIMQLLRDNLTLWTTDMSDEGEPGAGHVEDDGTTIEAM